MGIDISTYLREDSATVKEHFYDKTSIVIRLWIFIFNDNDKLDLYSF